jgi:DNA-binding transcriptional MerR regulator
MGYRVEELAASRGVSVDTIRYYQGLGLLPPPRRDGRVVLYSDAHLLRLDRIRELADSGFTLRQIGDLVDQASVDTAGDPLLAALAGQRPASATLSLVDLAERTGVAEPLLRLSVDAGLLSPVQQDGEERFDEEQAAMVETAGRLLQSGVDLEPLIVLATTHAANIESLVAQAVALYRAAVDAQPGVDRAQVAKELEALVPAVTRLVAGHFSRALVDHVAMILVENQPSGDGAIES